MCGIHGIFTKSVVAKRDLCAFIEQAFIVNTLRGMDSAGIFQIDRDGKPYMHKMNVPGFMFAETKVSKRFFADADTSPVTVGHVRAATQGKITVDNAHPFVVDKPNGKRVIGVHNGTITNWRGKKDSYKFDVDSEWALSRIANEGVDAFEEFLGAYAFVWWDEDQKNKMFMCRNSERPMHFVLTKDKSAMMFGSEAGMLAWLAERNKIETDGVIYSLDVNKLYTFDLTKSGEITWSKVEAPVYKSVASTSTNHSSASNIYDSTRGHGKWNAALARWEYSSGDTSSSVYGEDDYDDSEYGVMGYPPNYTRNYPAPRTTSHSSSNVSTGVGGGTRPASFPVQAERLLEDVKAVLATNRTSRNKREAAQAAANTGGTNAGDGAATTTATEVSTKPKHTIRLSRKEKKRLRLNAEGTTTPVVATVASKAESLQDAYRDGICPSDWYSATTATHAEKERAIAKGVMGELQWVQGGLYEPDTCELYGEVEEYIAPGQKLKHICIVRNESATSAKRNWIDNGAWGCVIGISDENRLDDTPALIISALTNKGKAHMLKRAS